MPEFTEQQLRDILQQEIREWFSTMPQDQIADLADRLTQPIQSNITLPALKKIKRAAPTRIMDEGADVNTDDDGNLLGHAGPTLPDIWNFLSTDITLEPGDARQVNIRPRGGGADCMFDYIVSTCWATEVAAGRGTEGQVMTSLTGCTFRVYSTVQGAVTHAADSGNPDGTRVIYICGGTYAEAVVGGGAAAGNQHVRLVGAGRDRVTIGGATSALPTFDLNGSGKVWMTGITWLTSSASHAVTLEANDQLIAWDCEFTGASSSRYGLTNGSALSTSIEVSECVFNGTHGLSNNTGRCWVTNNQFNSTTIGIQVDENTRIEGNYFTGGSTAFISVVNGSEKIVVRNNHFTTTAGACVLLNGTQHNYLWIENNHLGTDTGGPTTCFDLSSATSGNSDTWVIKGNTGTMADAGTFLKLPTTFSQSNAFNMFIRIQDNDVWTGTLAGTFVTGQYDHPIVTMAGNFLNHKPIEGVATQFFTGKVWYFSQEKPMIIGIIACTIRFGDTPVSVTAQTTTLAPGTNYIEVSSAGTLSSNLTAFTAGSMPILKVVCANDGSGNAVYTSHVDSAGILYVAATVAGGSGAAAPLTQLLSHGHPQSDWQEPQYDWSQGISTNRWVMQRIIFTPQTTSLVAEVLMPPRTCVGEAGEHGAYRAIRAKATAGTAGSGTNTILIEADDNPAFSSATTLFTLALNTSTEVEDVTLDNAWADADIHVRARCSAVDASEPVEVVVEFYYLQQVGQY